MHHRIILQSTFLFVLTVCFTLALQDAVDPNISKNDKDLPPIDRNKRGIKKPGFFITLFSTMFEQWNDTKYTLGTVNKLINDNFLPDNPPVTEPTTPPSNPNVSTTEPPYRISRAEFARILRRNLAGIRRLYDLELQDALKQSDVNYAQFKKNASIEVSKFL